MAPADIVPFIKQRMRWGQGAMQVLRRHGFIVFARGLSLAQKLSYLASTITYLDGWQKLVFYLAPVIVLVTGVISAFQAFDQIYALTPNGGPQGTTDVIASRIYYEAFQGGFNLGRASVMALVLFVILVTVTLVQQRFFAQRITYDLS